MDTKEVLKKIKNNTISTDELKKFSKDKQVIIAAVKKNGSNLKFADKQLKADKERIPYKLEKDYPNFEIESVERLIKNSIDKSKLDKFYKSSIEETKLALKKKST